MGSIGLRKREKDRAHALLAAGALLAVEPKARPNG
jgi:hypothetical protein